MRTLIKNLKKSWIGLKLFIRYICYLKVTDEFY